MCNIFNYLQEYLLCIKFYTITLHSNLKIVNLVLFKLKYYGIFGIYNLLFIASFIIKL